VGLPLRAGCSLWPPRWAGAGGKRAGKKQARVKNRSSKIRQGGPQEEAQLGEHLAQLGPSPALLEEAGQLAELLVLLGHLADARLLQRQLSGWAALHQEVLARLAAQRAAAEAQGVGQQQRRQQQGAEAAAAAAATAAPVAAGPSWKWDILRPAGA
jgi:hypothetical protein